MSVRPPAWNDAAQTGRISMKFDICIFFENPSRNFKWHWNLTRITDNLHEDQYTFLNTSRSIHLKIRIFSVKSCRVNQKTFLSSITFLFSKIAPFMRWWGKIWHSHTSQRLQYDTAHALCVLNNIWYSQTDHRWQYNTAHALCVLNNIWHSHTSQRRQYNTAHALCVLNNIWHSHTSQRL